MEKNLLSVKLIDLIVYFSFGLIIFCVVFFTALREADSQERNAIASKAQVQSEREAQSLYQAAKKGEHQ